MGGGEGKLAAHTLDALMRADKQIYHRVRYTMIETSGYHRPIQKSMLAAHENRLRFMTEEEWLAAPPHPGSIVLANELLDAFPVYRLRCDQGTSKRAGSRGIGRRRLSQSGGCRFATRGFTPICNRQA
nr:SAM-dependent methyltransferase [Paenibacillus larvae]